jgi:2-polyprenyl-3-methyl-5-hydroxy-6-metoxy-1,4-benzoquinol methylase
MGFDGGDYQARFDALADRGVDVHGEAALVRSLGPASVLDAGCGTGRVAIELARHGIVVVGVDVDPSMLAEARRRAPELDWRQADLTELALDRHFDVVVLAGNVPLFTAPGTEAALVGACAGHVAGGGALVAGFQLDQGYTLAAYDATCATAGLELDERWSTWDRQPYTGGSYAVSIHRRR